MVKGVCVGGGRRVEWKTVAPDEERAASRDEVAPDEVRWAEAWRRKMLLLVLLSLLGRRDVELM